MGMDPVTIGLGLSAASGIYGAISNNKAQNRAQNTADQNFNFQKQAFETGQRNLEQKNQMMQGLILPMLNGSGFNTGQDGMMQSMRGMPDGRPDPGYLDAMRKMSMQDLSDQLGQQRGSVGSLGQRFGTAELGNEARLRERAVTGLGATYANAGLQASQMQQQKVLGLLNILSGGQANTGMTAPQQQIIPQQNGIPGAVGDIGNMIMLFPFLKGMMGGGGGTPNMTNSGYAPSYPNTMGSGIPGSLFGGVRY